MFDQTSFLTNDDYYLIPMLIGVPSIDDCHDAVIQMTSQIVLCNEHEVTGIFRSVIAALEQTFDQEQQLMEEFHFPLLKCHMEQHARVLASLHQLHCNVMDGDYTNGRRVAGELLPEWFQLHEATQDAALGIWIAYSHNSERVSNTDKYEASSCHFDKQLPQQHEQKQSKPKLIRGLGPLL